MESNTILILIGIAIFLYFLFRKKDKEGRYIPESVKRDIIRRQGGTCALCPERRTKLLQFHHKNGNYTDNNIENIVALCGTCHDMKSRYDQSKK